MADVQKDLEALQLALQTEEEGYELFRKAADAASSEFVKDLFNQLAKDELLHKNLIKKFYLHLKDTGSWAELSPEDKDLDAHDKEIKTIFSKALDQAKGGTLDIGDSDVEVYRRAVQFEKDGADLYDRLYNETDDEKAKKFYAFLRQMEQEHMELLDNTLQYLENPDNWYLLQEGWTLED